MTHQLTENLLPTGESYAGALLTVEEFATIMKVGRSTVYAWISNGNLECGRHYMRIGGVVRFPWGSEAVKRLLVDSKASNGQEKPTARQTARRARNGKARINLDT